MTVPYYSDDLVTLYHGDCLDVLPTLAEGSFDLTFTSPPYNLGEVPWPSLGHWKPGDGSGGHSKWRNGSDAGGGIQYAGHEDAMAWDDYEDWQRRCLAEMWRLTSECGAIYYQHKQRVVGGRLWSPLSLAPPCLVLRQEIIWKRAGGLNFTEVAYVPTHERIYVFAKPAFRLRTKGASGVGDVWTFPQQASDHPAPFPLDLPSTAIETTGPGSVLDPFAGSGTTLLAAKNAGVRAVGIEKSERYCEMAAARLGSWRHSVSHPGSLFAEGEPCQT